MAPHAIGQNFGLVRSLEELQTLVDRLLASDKPYGFDIETGYSGPDKEKGSLNPDRGAYVVGFSFAGDTSWARYVPVRHDTAFFNLNPEKTFAIIKPLLESTDDEEQGRCVAHNLKFEERFMRKEGIQIAARADSQVQAFNLSRWKGVALKHLTKEVFNYDQAQIATLFPGMKKKDEKTLRFNVLDSEDPDVISYACDDAVWTLALFEKFDPELQGDLSFTNRTDTSIIGILSDMEEDGTGVDWDAMRVARAQGEEFIARFEENLKDNLSTLAGESVHAVNLNSVPQLRELLYVKLGLPIVKMTDNENNPQPSTDAVALEGLAQREPAIRQLLQLREIKNLIARLKKWDVFSDSPDGRVHASYNQTVIASGRFSANDPAIQQCPKDWRWDTTLIPCSACKELDAPLPDCQDCTQPRSWNGNFRKFIATNDDGYYYLGFDYSQIELRVLAALSQEPALIEAFASGTDVHTVTAAKILGIPVEEVDPKVDRPVGKTMNFGLLYGMSVKGLADRLGVSKEEAQEKYDAYFAGLPGIKVWMDRVQREGRSNLATVSWIGRRSAIWELAHPSRAMQAKGERMLVNVPVQGGAADYMKIAMVRTVKVLKDKGWYRTKVRMTMNQHDHLAFDVHPSLDPREVAKVLKPAVEIVVKGWPPVTTDWEFGPSWGEAVEFGVDSNLVCSEAGVWSLAPEGVALEEVLVQDAPSEEETTVIEEHSEPSIESVDSSVTVVELASMPTKAQWQRFMIEARKPGDNVLVVRTPAGELPTDIVDSALDPADEARIRIILPGSRVYRPADAIDVDAFAGSLEL